MYYVNRHLNHCPACGLALVYTVEWSGTCHFSCPKCSEPLNDLKVMEGLFKRDLDIQVFRYENYVHPDYIRVKLLSGIELFFYVLLELSEFHGSLNFDPLEDKGVILANKSWMLTPDAEVWFRNLEQNVRHYVLNPDSECKSLKLELTSNEGHLTEFALKRKVSLAGTREFNERDLFLDKGNLYNDDWNKWPC